MVSCNHEELLNVKEAAQVLKIGINAMYKLIHQGEIHVLKLNGNKIRRATLDEFIRQQEQCASLDQK